MTVKDREKIKDLVKQCRTYRLTTDESLNFLEEHGHKISERTFRRIKKELDSNTTQRLLEIAEHEMSDEYFHYIDTRKKIEKECWQLLENSTSATEKLKIFDRISKSGEELFLMLHEGDLVKRIKETMDSRFAELKKLQQNSA